MRYTWSSLVALKYLFICLRLKQSGRRQYSRTVNFVFNVIGSNCINLIFMVQIIGNISFKVFVFKLYNIQNYTPIYLCKNITYFIYKLMPVFSNVTSGRNTQHSIYTLVYTPKRIGN